MFEKTTSNFEVSVRMLDGATIRGTLSKGQSSTLEGILSKETAFLEFVSKDGQRKFISKHQIAYVEPVEPLKRPYLVSPKDPRYVDAFSLLGINKDCTFDEAKQVYHRLAKEYHPDNYAGISLPKEVETYVTEMFRQINTAFTEVRAELQSTA